MYCTKCGFKNEDDAMFCANCGSVMTKMPYSANNQDIQPENNTGEPIEKSILEPVSPVDDHVQTEQEAVQPETVQQNPEPVQPIEENHPQVSLEKPEAVQPNIINSVNNASGIPTDLYRSPYTVEPAGNANTYQRRQFSAPRFIFSLIILLATVFSIVTIAFDYAGIKVGFSMYGFGESESEYTTGFRIIKEKVEMDELDLDEDIDDMEGSDYVDSVNNFRYCVIAFAVAMLVFCIIDFMMLCLVRKKIAYIFIMIFAVIKAAIGGFAIYLWSVNVLEQFEKIFQMYVSEYDGIEITLECIPGIGMILALSMQAVIFISAIILLCIKPKYRDMAPQTISA